MIPYVADMGIPMVGGVPRDAVPRLSARKRGRCVWCGRDIDSPHRGWHRHCVALYLSFQGANERLMMVLMGDGGAGYLPPSGEGLGARKCMKCGEPGSWTEYRPGERPTFVEHPGCPS